MGNVVLLQGESRFIPWEFFEGLVFWKQVSRFGANVMIFRSSAIRMVDFQTLLNE
jgi:hypothetical protein